MAKFDLVLYGKNIQFIGQQMQIIIFFFIFLSRIVKLMDGLCSPKNLNHIGETKGLQSNIKTPLNTGVIRNHQIITSIEAQKIMKSGRLLLFLWGGERRSAIMSTNN